MATTQKQQLAIDVILKGIADRGISTETVRVEAKNDRGNNYVLVGLEKFPPIIVGRNGGVEVEGLRYHNLNSDIESAIFADELKAKRATKKLGTTATTPMPTAAATTAEQPSTEAVEAVMKASEQMIAEAQTTETPAAPEVQAEPAAEPAAEPVQEVAPEAVPEQSTETAPAALETPVEAVQEVEQQPEPAVEEQPADASNGKKKSRKREFATK